MYHLVPQEVYGAVGGLELSHGVCAPFILQKMNDGNYKNTCPAVQFKPAGVYPDGVDVGESKHGGNDKVRGAVNQQSPDALPLPTAYEIRLEGEISQKMRKYKTPENKHVILRSD